MANISVAHGNIEFVNFTKKEIQQWINKYENEGYGFNEIVEGAFSGTGRWSFCSTLEENDWGLVGDQEILLNFYDEEPGCELYYYQAGIIDKDGYSFGQEEYYSLEETLNIPDFETIDNLYLNLEDFGWYPTQQYDNGDCPEIWEIENEKGEKRKVDLETILDYGKLEEELENE